MSDDLISRQKTLKRLCEKCTEGIETSTCGRRKCSEYRLIKDMPSADRPQGEWKSVYKYKLHARPTCTVCGYDGEDEKYGRISSRIVEHFRFCPNCGARMEESR